MVKNSSNLPLTFSMDIPRNPRYLSLDIWRGVACLMIVVYHSVLYVVDNPNIKVNNFIDKLIISTLSMLWAGVPIFFVISGYCIAATSDSVRRKPCSVKQFFLRRFRRIFPPYWILIILSLILILGVSAAGWPNLFNDTEYKITALNQPSTLSLSQWFGVITLTEEWRFHIFGDTRRWFASHAWSLSYEEQFYAVCGLLLFLSPKRFFPATLVITIIVLALALINFRYAYLPINGFFFDGRWLLFALGILVYYQVNYASKMQIRLIYCILGLGVLFTVLLRYSAGIPNGLFTFDDHNRKLTGDLAVSSLFALTISLFHKFDARLITSKILQPIRFCGIMCYSLYLVHWPITNGISHVFYLAGIKGLWPTLLITVPVAAGVSIWLSWLFYLSVERYFLNPPATVSPNTSTYTSISINTSTAAETDTKIPSPILVSD